MMAGLGAGLFLLWAAAVGAMREHGHMKKAA